MHLTVTARDPSSAQSLSLTEVFAGNALSLTHRPPGHRLGAREGSHTPELLRQKPGSTIKVLFHNPWAALFSGHLARSCRAASVVGTSLSSFPAGADMARAKTAAVLPGNIYTKVALCK